MIISNKEGFMLSDISISIAIILIIASIAFIGYSLIIDNSKINKMKYDVKNLEYASLSYFERYGVFPIGETVELSSDTYNLIYDNSGGRCNNSIKGSIVSRPGKEIVKDGKIYSGSYVIDNVNIKKDIDFEINAYNIDFNAISKFISNLTREKLNDYIIIDCTYKKLENENNDIDENCNKLYKCIYTAEDLYNVRFDLKGHYVLMNDIDLSSLGNWVPIGNVIEITEEQYLEAINYILKNYNMTLKEYYNLPEDDRGMLLDLAYNNLGYSTINEFEGVLDGNGYEITGLKMNSLSDYHFIGLFFAVNNAEIKNLSIKGIDVDINEFETRGDYFVELVGGGFAAMIRNSSIDDIEVTGNIKLNVKNFRDIKDINIAGFSSIVINSYINNVKSFVDYETTLSCVPVNHPLPDTFINNFNRLISIYYTDSVITNSYGYGEKSYFDMCY